MYLELFELNPNPNHAWYVLGNFNEILSHDEKDGGRPRADSLMEDFRKALQDNNLSNLGWNGLKYTWCNIHLDKAFTR